MNHPEFYSDGCKILIDPKPGARILRVVKFHTWISLIPEKDNNYRTIIDFDYCTPPAQKYFGVPFGLYLIKVRINGKKEKKSINLGSFNGYLYIGSPSGLLDK